MIREVLETQSSIDREDRTPHEYNVLWSKAPGGEWEEGSQFGSREELVTSSEESEVSIVDIGK